MRGQPRVTPGFNSERRAQLPASPGYIQKKESKPQGFIWGLFKMRGQPRVSSGFNSERRAQLSVSPGFIQKEESKPHGFTWVLFKNKRPASRHLGTIMNGEPSLQSYLGVVQSHVQKREGSFMPEIVKFKIRRVAFHYSFYRSIQN